MTITLRPITHFFAACAITALAGCSKTPPEPTTQRPGATQFSDPPLIQSPHAANPAARVFDDRLYVYASHDGTPNDGTPEVVDYRVFSLAALGETVTDHGPAMHIGEVPWARQQLSGPDVAEHNGTYFLYFAAQDDKDIYRIGVATAPKPEGPFTPELEPIAGTYSSDPSLFQDSDGAYYLLLGATGPGQLQRWQGSNYSAQDSYPAGNSPTLLPRIAKLAGDLLTLEHPLTTVPVADETGNLIAFGDVERRFSAAPFIHKHQATYYLSWYSDNAKVIQYATGDSPYGPFQWRGKLMEPVFGTANHHAIVNYQDQWLLVYHDASQSGDAAQRTVKGTKIQHNSDGTITTIDAYVGDN